MNTKLRFASLFAGAAILVAACGGGNATTAPASVAPESTAPESTAPESGAPESPGAGPAPAGRHRRSRAGRGRCEEPPFFPGRRPPGARASAPTPAPAAAILSPGASAARTPTTADEFDTYFKQVSNWGRWGATDERGAANLITEAKGKQAAAHLMEASEGDIEFGNGRFTIAGTDRGVSILELAAKLRSGLKLPPDVRVGAANAAIVGGVVVLRAGPAALPASWLRHLEPVL